MTLTLSVDSAPISVCKLSFAEWPIPPRWCDGYLALIHEPASWTLICSEGSVPPSAVAEGGWCVLRLEGTFDFGLTGVLVSILNPLAEAKVGIFALSTFDTDCVLINISQIEIAKKALLQVGHVFVE